MGAILRELRLHVEFSDTFDVLENETVKKELPEAGAHDKGNASDYWSNGVSWCTRNGALNAGLKKRDTKSVVKMRG